MSCIPCQNKKNIWNNAWSFLNKWVKMSAQGDWYKVVSVESSNGPIKRIGLDQGPEQNLRWVLPHDVHDVKDRLD
jgi:hypothetical protein